MPSLEAPLISKLWENYTNPTRSIQTAKENKNEPMPEEFSELQDNYHLILEQNKILTRKLKNSKEDWMKLNQDTINITKRLLIALISNKVTQEVINEANIEVVKCEQIIKECNKEDNIDESKDTGRASCRERVYVLVYL